MLLKRDQSSVLIVDMQTRLLPAIDDWQRTLDNVIWLVKLAQELAVPVMASEQYRKGLGETHEDLRALIPDAAVAEKLHFSCAAARCLGNLAGHERRQIVICGIEAHVCVLQTALDLKNAGKEVFVVAEGVASRRPESKRLALERLRHHGVDIVNGEMVAFEWLRRAGTPEFRAVSQEFLRALRD